VQGVFGLRALSSIEHGGGRRRPSASPGRQHATMLHAESLHVVAGHATMRAVVSNVMARDRERVTVRLGSRCAVRQSYSHRCAVHRRSSAVAALSLANGPLSAAMIPVELVCHIASFGDAHRLCAMRATCSLWRQIIHDDSERLWKAIALASFRWAKGIIETNSDWTFEKLYRNLAQIETAALRAEDRRRLAESRQRRAERRAELCCECVCLNNTRELTCSLCCCCGPCCAACCNLFEDRCPSSFDRFALWTASACHRCGVWVASSGCCP
jgi:hypothetical protein